MGGLNPLRVYVDPFQGPPAPGVALPRRVPTWARIGAEIGLRGKGAP